MCSNLEQTQNFINQKSRQILQIAKENNVAKLSNSMGSKSLAPFTMVLQPFRISQEEFDKLRKYSKLWQKITSLASTDSQFILASLKNLAKDPMIGPMLNIFRQMVDHQEKTKQIKMQEANHHISFKNKPQIILFRTDFFITDDVPSKIKLIQYNNMSVSMAGISQQFQACQKKLWGNSKNIIDNNSTSTFAQGLVQFYKKNNLNGVMLVVVMENQTNVVDQGLLFQAIQSHSQIQIVKVFLENLEKQVILDENQNLLHHNKKVALVYYRAGYSSNEKINWDGIRKCNLSSAINIPSINEFLIGTKKMQAELSKKQNMLKYLSEAEANVLIESVIDTWDFQEKGSKQKILQLIQKEGHEGFVLKPNEQGGKHNLFGQDAYKKVKHSDQDQLLNYILTKKIKSRSQSCTLVRSLQWDYPEIKSCQIQSQVSIYGCVCSSFGCNCLENCKCCINDCFVNCCEGYLVRSKPEGVNEGGLMAGTGAICGLQLVKNNEL